MRKRGTVIAVLALIGFVVAGLFGSPAVTAAEPAKRLSVVLLGDSYSAGNGAGSYVYGDDSYRSSKNWASNYVNWLSGRGVHATLTNLAHSGYTSQQVLDNQIKGVPSNADLVMLTIGGNDVNFTDVVKQCFTVGIRDPKACRERVEAAEAGLGGVMSRTEEILQKLSAKLDSQAQVVLVGYPLLSTDRDYKLTQCYSFCTKWDTYDAGTAVRNLGNKATRDQQSLINSWNGSHALKATYIDNVSTSFAGHEPDPSVNSRNDYRWLNEFVETQGRSGGDGKTASDWSGDTNNFYHPNLIGHQKIANLVSAKLGVPSSAKVIAPSGGDIDIVFAIDTTGSMSGAIDSVKTNVRSIIDSVRAKTSTYRFALVTYKDHPVGGGDSTDYPSQVDLGFGSDVSKFETVLDGLEVSGGGDWEESVYSGAMAGLGLDWRPGVRKVMIVLGDAPPKDPEPVSGFTAAAVAKKAFDVDPVEIYAIDTGALQSPEMASLVEATGGTAYNTGSSGDIPALIADAVTTALNKPFAWLQGPYVGRLNDTITLDASGSYATIGALTRYEWDFNGDGTYDAETATPVTDHQFAALFDGTIGVRVTASDGQTAVGSTSTKITDDGDTVPRASDNCPDLANQGQTDYDADGIGDECDSTPGYPTADKPGVYEILDGAPLPVDTTAPPSPTATPSTTAPPSPTAPASAAVTLSSTKVAAGGQLTISGTRYPANSTGEVWLHSVPVLLGELRSDTEGAFTASMSIASGAEPGEHTIEVTVGGVKASASLTVTPASAPGGVPDPTVTPASIAAEDSSAAPAASGESSLPSTGANGSIWSIGAGAVLVSAGLIVILWTRRRASNR
jgi:LPXTG-motif cell wall-anchored protein